MYQLIKKLMFCQTIMTLITINSTAVAKVKAVTGQLILMATLDGTPAFRAVIWKLIPDTKDKNVATINVYKHAATLDLEPGDYQISVTLGSKTKTYQITIKESSKQELIVSLD